MPPAPRPQGEVSARRHNLSLVLRLLADGGPCSRAGIAAATGLTKATSSNLVQELASRGLVHDTEVVRGANGRPATMVAVSPAAISGIGVVIDVDEVRVAAIDLTGAAQHQGAHAFDARSAGAAHVVQLVGHAVDGMLRRLRTLDSRPVGLTVAVPGLVAGDEVVVAPNLGWERVPLARMLTEEVRRAGYEGDVALDNEANLAALAEARTRKERSFILVSAGVGIGAGVVTEGALFRGAHGFGGELGHFVVDPDGARCGCGNRGCLETIAGQRSLMRACGHRSNGSRAAAGAWLPRIAAEAGAGSARVLAALDHVAGALAAALASAVSLFDPEAVVLGGYLTALAPWVAPRIEKQLRRRVLGSRFLEYPVQASTVGPSASLLGAGWSGLSAVLTDPLLVPARTPR